MERVGHNPRPVTLTTYFPCLLCSFFLFNLKYTELIPNVSFLNLLNCVPRFEDDAENE